VARYSILRATHKFSELLDLQFFYGGINPTQIFIDLNPNGQNNSSKMFHIFGLDQNPCQNIKHH
jgi:hypothetical protein